VLSLLAEDTLGIDSEVQVYIMLQDWAQPQIPNVQAEAMRLGFRDCVRVRSMPRTDIGALLANHFDALYAFPLVMKMLTGALLDPNQGLVRARPSSRLLVWDVQNFIFKLGPTGTHSQPFEWAGAEWYGPRHAN
jgi:hypothetical protein